MSITTLTKGTATLIAAGTSNAAGATTRGVVDMRTDSGGFLTMKLTNSGALGAQAEARILVSHDSGTTPAAASAGLDWKTVYRVGNGLVSGTVGEWCWTIPAGVKHVEVEVTGNTTNAVVCEAFVSDITNATSV